MACAAKKKYSCRMRRNPTRTGGFTYIGMLLFVAIMGVALGAVGDVWKTVRQQEKEQELLYIGHQFRLALTRYASQATGPVKRYPAKLEDLLRDPRNPGVKRYLRKIYNDPITGGTDWGLVKSVNGEILGIYSLSEEKPLKQANFSKADISFENAAKYRDWVFQTGQTGLIQGPTGGMTGGSNVRK